MHDRPSATAVMIAEATVQVAGTGGVDGLVPPQALLWSERFVDEIHGRKGAASRLREPFLRMMAAHRERVSVPGIRLHYLLRKRWIEDAVRQAVAEGCNQVVVLAAGFDTLAVRMAAELEDVLFVELDHPATQEVKLRAVEKAGSLPYRNLLLLPIDLTREGPEKVLLSAPRFDASQRALFIAEGILMYLLEAEIDRLLRSLLSGSGPRELIFTFFETRDDGRIGFKRSTFVTDLWLKLKGEPFRWACDPAKLDAFLRSTGFRLVDLSTPSLLRSRYLKDQGSPTLAEGESVAVAVRI